MVTNFKGFEYFPNQLNVFFLFFFFTTFQQKGSLLANNTLCLPENFWMILLEGLCFFFVFFLLIRFSSLRTICTHISPAFSSASCFCCFVAGINCATKWNVKQQIVALVANNSTPGAAFGDSSSTASRIFIVQPRIISSVRSDRLPHLPLLSTFNPLSPLTSAAAASARLKQPALAITLTSSCSSNNSTVVLIVSHSG